MASFHASTCAVLRGSGHSSIAKAAYILGEKLTNKITGEIHDYTKRSGVEYTETILPEGITKEISTEELWNKAEYAENRKDARVGREWTIALPHELTEEQRKELAIEIAKGIAERYQVGIQIAIHEPSKYGDDRNYHVHILSTTRKIDQELNLTDKSDIERDRKQCAQLGILTSQEQIVQLREMIATKINLHLEIAQVYERVSHLSYKDQNIDKIPTKHLGKEITHLERKGVLTELGDHNRNIKLYNELKSALKLISYEHFQEQKHVILRNTEFLTNTEQSLLAKLQAKHNVSDIITKYNIREVELQNRIKQEKKYEQQQTQEQNYQKIRLSRNRGLQR